jgi:hypothetical protein
LEGHKLQRNRSCEGKQVRSYLRVCGWKVKNSGEIFYANPRQSNTQKEITPDEENSKQTLVAALGYTL